LSDLPPHVVERRIRDGLDAARLTLGVMAQRGLRGVMDDLTPLIKKTARTA
jgi:hypothetical protein